MRIRVPLAVVLPDACMLHSGRKFSILGPHPIILQEIGIEYVG